MLEGIRAGGLNRRTLRLAVHSGILGIPLERYIPGFDKVRGAG